MRSVLLYLLLVGAPAALLLGILRVGQDIQAPPSVGGPWEAQPADRPAGTPPFRLDLTQSGEHVQVVIDSAYGLRGRLAGDSIVAIAEALAVVPAGEEDVFCSPYRGMAFRARVDGEAVSRRMTGIITYTRPDLCPPLPFTAERLASQGPGGGGH